MAGLGGSPHGIGSIINKINNEITNVTNEGDTYTTSSENVINVEAVDVDPGKWVSHGNYFYSTQFENLDQFTLSGDVSRDVNDGRILLAPTSTTPARLLLDFSQDSKGNIYNYFIAARVDVTPSTSPYNFYFSSSPPTSDRTVGFHFSGSTLYAHYNDFFADGTAYYPLIDPIDPGFYTLAWKREHDNNAFHFMVDGEHVGTVNPTHTDSLPPNARKIYFHSEYSSGTDNVKLHQFTVSARNV